MAYSKQTWVNGADGATPISAARLGYIEDGIEAAHTAAAAAASTVHTHVSADITDATASATASTLVKRDGSGDTAVGYLSLTGTSPASGQAVRKDYVDGGLATKSDTGHTHSYAPLSHTHTSAEVTDLTESVQDTVGAMIEAGSGVTVAYNDTTGILSIDATGSGLTSVGYADLPAGTTLTVLKSGTWPARPTSRADIIVAWKGADPSPSIVSSGTGGMRDNVDYRLVTP